MTKYVIDLPDGTTAVVAKKSSFLHNETDVMRIPVSQLEMYIEPTVAENAPVEKRVIELPADLIAWLERMKSNLEIIDVYDFFNDVLADNSRSYVSYQLNFNSEAEALNTLAEWLLGHVEFVPNDEARYKVLITGYSIDGGNQFVNMDSDNGDILFINEELAITYSKSEADKVIEHLGGENGFLQLRKVKVEE